MRIFETPFKNKELKEFYETLKAALVDKERAVDDDKSDLKSIRRAIENIPANVTVFDLNFSGRFIHPKLFLALLKVLAKRNASNNLIWPVASLSFAGCDFLCESNPADLNASTGTPGKLSSKPVSKSRSLIGIAQGPSIEVMINKIADEICSYLKGTAVLRSLDLSNNQLGNSFVSKLLKEGLISNSSIRDLNFANTGMDGAGAIPDIFVELLLSDNEARTMGYHKAVLDGRYNHTLRSLDISDNPWTKESQKKFTELAFYCTHLTYLKLAKQDWDLRFGRLSLEEILQRNLAVTSAMDEILSGVLTKRAFKDKLSNFKNSINENRLRKQNGNPKMASVADMPVYKMIALQNEEMNQSRLDPYHPNVFSSATWKSGYAISIGQREEMQDVVAMRGKFREYKVETQESTETHYDDFWAVFDGHGGRESAKYAADNLHQIIADNMNKLHEETATVQERADIITASFKQIQKDMAPWNTITGTTALALYIHDNMRYIANLGDSRALLYNSKDEIPLILTKDHRTNDPKEKKRIVNFPGGFVENGKVNGKLSVTRALGDSDLTPYVSCVPDITFAEIRPEDEFIIMASDGLWDVFAGAGGNLVERASLSNPNNMSKFMVGCKELIKIVNESTTPSVAAKKLAEYALMKGSTDNISVIVIYLRTKRTENAVTAPVTSDKESSAVNASSSNDVKIQTGNPLFKPQSLDKVPEKLQMVPESTESTPATSPISPALSSTLDRSKLASPISKLLAVSTSSMGRRKSGSTEPAQPRRASASASEQVLSPIVPDLNVPKMKEQLKKSEPTISTAVDALRVKTIISASPVSNISKSHSGEISPVEFPQEHGSTSNIKSQSTFARTETSASVNPMMLDVTIPSHDTTGKHPISESFFTEMLEYMKQAKI